MKKTRAKSKVKANPKLAPHAQRLWDQRQAIYDDFNKRYNPTGQGWEEERRE